MKQMPDDDEMLRLVFGACPAAMLLVDGEGRIELANEECERMFGYERGALAGARIEELMPAQLRGVHRMHRAEFAAAPAKRQMGMGRDLVGLRRDGSEFFIEVGLAPLDTRAGPRVLAFAVDITARRDSEYALRRALHEVELANENLARFAYAASHDIQEPLRKISAFAELLGAAMAEENRDEALYSAQVMASSARRAREIVDSCLALARSSYQPKAPEIISVRKAVMEVLDSLSQAIAETGADVECVGDDFRIQGDKMEFFRLTQNLVSNALKYRAPDRPPYVRVVLTVGESEDKLAVEDEGIGFPAEQRDEIFKPFRRLHSQGDIPGAGIGLAICQNIAKRHGWRLSATSIPNVGSIFEVEFPKKHIASDQRRS